MQATLTEPAASALAGDLTNIEVSVVMPCLNEGRAVGRCVEKAIAGLHSLDVRGEAIVADNGSSDGLLEVARTRGARVVQAPHRGYGSAATSGVSVRRAKVSSFSG